MKKAAPPPAISDAELHLAICDAVARLGKPTSPVELRRALPKPYQRPLAEITRLLAELARRGKLFAVKDSKGFRYADRDPAPMVAAAIQAALRGGPLDDRQLAAQVKRALPALDKLVPTVLSAEVARGAVRVHPKAVKQKPRYGLEPPDPTPFLAKALKEIAAVAKQLGPSGVTTAAIHAALGRALGLDRDGGRPPMPERETDDAAVRAALHELASREPPGALLSVRDLRGLLALDKPRFDGAVLRLAGAGEIVLHHHDFPTSLPEGERERLVRDAHDVHYVGVALRPDGGRS
jgi:hypothetical protein